MNDHRNNDEGAENNHNHPRQWKPTIIQITSLVPASGKTHFLYLITAHAVLSAKDGGQETTVVWLDTDHRFSASRLADVIGGLVSSSNSPSSPFSRFRQPRVPSVERSERTHSIIEALSQVHVFRPQSSQQLCDTLDHLPSYLLDLGAHPSRSRRLGWVVLDSATAFHWQDRLEAETLRLANPFQAVRDRSPGDEAVITRLKRVQKQFDCSVCFSTSSWAHLAMTGRRKGSTMANTWPTTVMDETPPPQQPRGVSPWTFFATLSLQISRTDNAKGPTILQRATRERRSLTSGNRPRILGMEPDTSFLIKMDYRGSQLWTVALKEGLHAMGAEKQRFHISVGGIVSVSS